MNAAVCAFGLVLCFNSRVLALGDKAYLCQDPEDGSLHPVNTSWQSSMFCGNYTCKIKKKPRSIKEDLKMTEPSKKPEEITVCAKQKCIERNKDLESLVQNDKSSRQAQASNDIQYPKDSFASGSDFISQILDSVDNNQHDRIEEAYNLSKDYKTEVVDANQNTNDISDTKKSPQTVSYFYEPMLIKATDMKDPAYISLLSSKSGHNTAPKPVIYRVNEITVNSSLPCDLKHHITPKLVKMPFSVETRNSMRRRLYLPFPILNAIRAAQMPDHDHYSNNHVQHSRATDVYSNRQPYQTVDNMMTNVNGIRRSSTENAHSNLIQSEALINLPNNMYLPGQLVVTDMKPNSHPHAKLIRFPTKHAYLEHTNHAWYKNESLGNPMESKQMPIRTHRTPYSCAKSFLIKKLMLRKNKLRMPWQANDLNFLTKGKDTKLVKTKLQRIGKVIKMDNLIRHRREIETKSQEATEEFEFYLEKIVCPEQVELGYYKVGNSSRPFPQCCPQKIEKLKTEAPPLMDPDYAYYKQ